MKDILKEFDYSDGEVSTAMIKRDVCRKKPHENMVERARGIGALIVFGNNMSSNFGLASLGYIKV